MSDNERIIALEKKNSSLEVQVRNSKKIGIWEWLFIIVCSFLGGFGYGLLKWLIFQ